MTRRAIQFLIAWSLCLPTLRSVAADADAPSGKSPEAGPKPAETKAAGASAADQPNSDPRIESLLDSLESADVKVRDRAQQDLIRAGPAAVVPLDERLKEAASPEFVSRAKLVKEGITRAWRYWDPAGGRISGGFQASLLPVDDVLTFKAGGAILLNLEIRNVSPEARRLSDIRGFDLDLGAHAVFESPFCDARIVLRRVDGGEMPREARAIVIGTDAPRVIDFKTGGNILMPVRIDEGVTLTPADYEIRVVYYGKSHARIAGATSDLEAGPIRFKVTSEPGPEKPK